MLTFRLSTAIGKLTPRTVYKLLWFRILIHLRAADLGLETKNGSGLWWRATGLYNRRVHFLNYEISKLEDKKFKDLLISKRTQQILNLTITSAPAL